MEQDDELTQTVHFPNRVELYKFRFVIKDFNSYTFIKESPHGGDIVSSPFTSRGVDKIEWRIKVQLLQKNAITFADCRIEKVSTAPSSYIGRSDVFHALHGGNLLALGGTRDSSILHCPNHFIFDGTLTLQCDLRLIYEAKGNRSSGSSDVTGLRELQSDFKDLYLSRKNSDVVLRCGDQNFSAHKAILSARSPVFSRMFEHDMRENQENVVKIEDVTPEIVQAMLHHIYCGQLEERISAETNMLLYALADKYDLKGLKSCCSEFVAMNLNVDNVCEVAILAHLHNDAELLSATKEFFDWNLRDIVLSTAWIGLSANYHDLAEALLNP